MDRPADGYREWAPHPALARFVDCFWTKEGAGTPAAPVRVLPDGCIDFLIEPELGAARIVGAMTRPVDARANGRIAAVRFRPGGAAPFLRASLDELTDADAPLDAVWRGAAHAIDRVANARSAVAAVRALERALLACDPRPTRTDALVLDVSASIGADPTATSIDSLAAAAGASRQHLTRAFRARVGYGPKMLARVLRLRALLDSLAGAGARARGLARLALDHGYCDQAHLANEVRALTGRRPTDLCR